MHGDVKRSIQDGVRSLHVRLLNRGLPERVGVCLHELVPARYGAFRDLVDFYRDAGYRFVDPAELCRPGGSKVLLSFDDNYRSWFEALPLLAALNVQATFYVNTGAFRGSAEAAEVEAYFRRLGAREDHVSLSVPELRAIDESGHTIAAHGHRHLRLSTVPVDRAREEIRLSRVVLEDLLGHEVRHFSYPYGMRRYFSADLRDYCRALGFVTVANAIPGLQHGRVDPFDLNRSVWDLRRPLSRNVEALCIDGRLWERLTGRSAAG